MKNRIAIIIFLLIFLISCLSNRFNQYTNVYLFTKEVSTLQTLTFQAIYTQTITLAPPTNLPTITPTNTYTATLNIPPVLLYSEKLGKNCSTELNFTTDEIDYDLNKTLANMIMQLPPDIITPPPGIVFDPGLYSTISGHGGNWKGTCHFVSIPRKSTHGYSGYTFWNGESNMIYWTEGFQSMGGNESIYGNNGGWYWLAFLRLTQEMEIQMLTPEYLKSTSTSTFNYHSAIQTFEISTKTGTQTLPFIP